MLSDSDRASMGPDCEWNFPAAHRTGGDGDGIHLTTHRSDPPEHASDPSGHASAPSASRFRLTGHAIDSAASGIFRQGTHFDWPRTELSRQHLEFSGRARNCSAVHASRPPASGILPPPSRIRPPATGIRADVGRTVLNLLRTRSPTHATALSASGILSPAFRIFLPDPHPSRRRPEFFGSVRIATERVLICLVRICTKPVH
jgi:hypothetical protein